jgi:hypothetical protein
MVNKFKENMKNLFNQQHKTILEMQNMPKEIINKALGERSNSSLVTS